MEENGGIKFEELFDVRIKDGIKGSVVNVIVLYIKYMIIRSSEGLRVNLTIEDFQNKRNK